jgi:hypothetical protein
MVKAATFLTTALINVGISAIAFFMLIISLNGFSERQAEAGLILFIIWAFLSAVITGILSSWSANRLIKEKSFNIWIASFLAITTFVVVGLISNIVGFFAAVLLTSAIH